MNLYKGWLNWRKFGGSPLAYLPFHWFGKMLLRYQQHLALCVRLYQLNPDAQGVCQMRDKADVLCLHPNTAEFFNFLNPSRCTTGHVHTGNLRIPRRNKYQVLTWIDLIGHLGGAQLFKQIDQVRFGHEDVELFSGPKRIATIEFDGITPRAEQVVQMLEFFTGLTYVPSQFPNELCVEAWKRAINWEVHAYHTI